MISHDHKFIFVHISRTGGSSLERLAGIGVTEDPRTHANGNTDFPEKHKNFSFFYGRYPDEFERFFKFTIVRNPYDRAVSAWIWRCTVVKDHDCSLKEFILTRKDWWGYQPRIKLDNMSFDESIKKFDFIGRFENLQDDVRTICKKVGLDYTKYPHTNRTVRRPYWEYFDDETLELFTNRFRQDIEYFGYPFGS